MDEKLWNTRMNRRDMLKLSAGTLGGGGAQHDGGPVRCLCTDAH
jgi:hypothetical protein